MPADDLALNVRQVAGYPPIGNAPTSAALLMQLGLGGAYVSVSPQALVSTALATGGDMAIGGKLALQAISGGSAQFSNGVFGMFAAQKACIVDLAATWGTIAGVAIATVNDLSAVVAAQKASTVWSFNGRGGDVRLWIDDIRCAGGAPIYSPRFEGSPRACTPPPESNSSRLATTAFVQNALAVSFEQFAPIDSPNFTGIPSAPTAAVGSSDGQLATTAFVQNAVTQSTTGVSSFNTRTGAVLLTAADITSIGGALVASPSFTGVPTAGTATPGTSSTQLATCAFVQAAVAAVTAGVSSFNSRTGDVILTAADVAAVAVSSFNGRSGAVFLLGNDISAAGGALLAGPAFTGAPSAPTAALGTGTTQLATCAFVQAAITAVTAGVTSWNGRSGAVTLQSADIAAVGGALLASPAFSGAPSAPTAAPGVSSTQLATTAFVAAAVSAGTAGVASFNSRTGAVTLLVADISGAGGALLASPNFTGVPTAPTALPSVSTTQIATTAFVNSVLPSASTAAPLMNGTAAAGASAAWSRGDHVHPSDTSRLPLIGGTLTGTLIAPDVNVNNNVSITNQINATNGGTIGGIVLSGGAMSGPGGAAISVGGCGMGSGAISYSSPPGADTPLPIRFGWSSLPSGYGTLITDVNGGTTAQVIRSTAIEGATFGVTLIQLTGALTAMYCVAGGPNQVSWSTATSDARLKFNLDAPSKDALSLVNSVAVSQCDFRHPGALGGGEHWDFTILADDVKAVLPYAYMAPPPEGFASLHPLHLISTLWRAVQQLSERVAALETRTT
jgi:hypothetical protein